MDETEACFVLVRDFAAPVARVWAAWTTPELLARWFGPKGVTTTMLAFELQPGGILHARMEMPGMPPYWARFTYREIVPERRLVWEHGFGDAAGDFGPSPFGGPWPRLLTVVEFAAVGEGTRVTLTWTPLDASEAEIAAFVATKPSMNGGWGGSFEVLDALLAG